MKTTGMIIEYNPLHCGHLYLVEEVRGQLGQDTAVIGVMSGDFVQRGDFAIVRRQARAKAAVESGVDLVLELPLPWATGSAERFADGGIRILEATGVVLSYICPLMYMNNPPCKSMRVMTCSNKLRTYTTARYYTEAEILHKITKGGK